MVNNSKILGKERRYYKNLRRNWIKMCEHLKYAFENIYYWKMITIFVIDIFIHTSEVYRNPL